MNTKSIKALVEIMEKSSLTAMEIEEADLKIRLERGNVISNGEERAEPIVFSDQLESSIESTTLATGSIECSCQLIEVKSPMIGVFYSSSSPNGRPFVSVGSQVKKGDVLCIIEAMKLMNEIQADQDGEIAEICVSNGQVVEFSQVLFRMK